MPQLTLPGKLYRALPHFYTLRADRGRSVPRFIRDLERLIALERQIPVTPAFRRLAKETGLIEPHTGGITLGRGIYILDGEVSNRLVSHELRHVHQYEAAGSIAAFLEIYLMQIATVGYDDAPLELDAQRYERDVP
jgi:hypothetical protein